MSSKKDQVETNSETETPHPPFDFFDGLEDCDVELLAVPSLSPLWRFIQADSPPLVRLAPSPDPQFRNTASLIDANQSTAPELQLRRTPSPITVHRRSSSRSNVSILDITWEDTNGTMKSLEFAYDDGTCIDRLFQGVAPADLQSNQQVSFLPNSQVATLPPSPVPRPQIQVDAHTLATSLQSHMPVVPQMPHLTASYTPPASQSVQPQSQVPRHRTRQHPNAGHFRPPVPSLPCQGHGGRPPPPPAIQPFVEPHHIPRNHGRVPDKRGLKDTTVANVYYYSIGQLPDLLLPSSRKIVSYRGVEFEPKLRLTGVEFLEYLATLPRGPGPAPRQPILRIQIQPAQYNHRYIRGGESFKCRMANCPDRRGTILKGQARVCIQEFRDERGDWLNPYHNAGYVHLFCLESQVDLIALYRDSPGSVLILPEDRKLEHEPPSTTNPRTNNPMALNDLERGVVDDWLQEIGPRWEVFRTQYPDPETRPRFALEEKDQLFYRLTKAHLQNKATQTIQKKRKLEARGKITAHLDEFVGNVGKHAALRERMVAQQRQGQALPLADSLIPSPERASKRRRVTPPADAGLVPAPASRHTSPPLANHTQVGPFPDPDANRPPRHSPLSYEECLYLPRLSPGSPLTAEALARLPQPTAWPPGPVDIDDPAFFQIHSHIAHPAPKEAAAAAGAAVALMTPPDHQHRHRRRRRCPSLVLVASSGVGPRRGSSGRSGRASKLASSRTSAEFVAALTEWLEAQKQGEAGRDAGPKFGDGSRVQEIDE